MSKIVVIDTETTGLDPYKGGHRVIELAAIEIVDGELTGNSFRYYLNPEGKKNNPDAFRVHQISNEFLLDKPLFVDISEEFLAFIKGAELVSYNAPFDFKFLQAEIDKTEHDVVFIRDYKVSCLMKDVKSALNYHKWLKLDSACSRYGIDISVRKVHGALVDAMLAAELFLAVHKDKVKPLNRTPQRQPHTPPEPRPLPRAFKHPVTGESIQLNHCKNPQCQNYGVPAMNPKLDNSGKPKRGLGNDYKLTTTSIGKVLTCKLCGTSTRMINNRSFAMEALRNQQEYSLQEPACPNTGLSPDEENGVPDGRRYVNKKVNRKGKTVSIKKLKPACENSKIGILTNPKGYKKIGLNHSTVKGCENEASQRMQCKACKTRFNVPLTPSMGQGNADINVALFGELVNKGIINRIQETLSIPATTIYRRIEFFYRQCIQFDQFQMRQNIDALRGKNLHLSMDRQHVLVNWNDKHDKRPTKIVNTSTVCNETRFVFGSTINFDFISNWQQINSEARWSNDLDKPDYKRRYSQYIFNDKDMEGDDVGDTLALQVPAKHLLVQQTYSLMAHLNQMREIIKHANRTFLFADDDEGFELGICLVMREIIESNQLYPVLIKAERNNASQMQDKRAWAEQQFRRAGLDTDVLKTAKLDKANMTKLAQQYWAAKIHQRNLAMGDGKSEWLVHPFPKKKQTFQVKPLVAYGESMKDMEAIALTQASTHGVDNYFQMLRRRLNMTERPITSATNSRRWNGYAAYNPKWMTMLIEILRVYNNYVLTDEKTLKNAKVRGVKPTTPAQKLGLAKCHFSIEDILNFNMLT
ncbi:exonuclease domain-containing protein [Thalassomonas sp. M1454]|uniref:exonuclease domain-containing protein n=1 Tax=Thalassomonas sp. M1454 TaxID=2594477 RepID=UPI00117E107A|nr:exonuclease domain-containing protein [Thalassomonas sp. M1454]TRX57302.1 hypothetical protein FNN08_07345 [Thalassomonas sp. M1454]